MTAHREIPLKVTAWIDEGVAPLVAALNEFERVMTLDSCEGDADTGAYVLFRVRGDAQRAVDFTRALGEALSLETTPYLLQAEWRPGEDKPLLALSCPPDAVSALADALSACRTKLSLDGTEGREARNSTGTRHHRPTVPFGGGSGRSLA